MKNQAFVSWLLFILLHLSSTSFAINQMQVYIVYLGEHGGGKTLHEIEDSHHSYLHSVKGSKEKAKASLIYSYKNIINGFSALLTPDEANKLSEMGEVVSVFESRPRGNSIQTTRSWDFVSILEGGSTGRSNDGQELLNKAKYGEDVIVGVFDTGVWPESESFSPRGMKPIPKSWKGSCQEGVAFNSSHCNRKLIGARYYLKGYEAYYGPLNETQDYQSPRDKNGHGTHTASTLGGRMVPNTSVAGGFGAGTASGGAPMVRLAIYKVCWQIQEENRGVKETTYFDVDVLAAFDDAIADGVHVISLSLAPYGLNHYTKDGIAIGALHAVKRNIVVACSAGNDGPDPSSVRNVAPWIMTVAASSIDRVFSSPVVLGNGMRIQGQSVTPYKLDKMYPLVFAGDAEVPGTTTSGECLPGTLSQELVKGKIVLCLGNVGYNVVKGEEVRRAGGVGFILQNPVNGTGISVQAHVIPGTAVFYNDAAKILDYVKTQTNPNATVVPVDTVFGTPASPFMAAFSSTGPNGVDPNIIKPDITAPGLNILAAWSEASSPTALPDDKRVVKYNILSGTSMSCPHVAAAAALLKAVHPHWSSAAIRSALMTTAQQNNNNGGPITNANGYIATPFNYGSGHIRPSHAADPGLVYDANYTDYLLYLCNDGENNIDPSFKCPDSYPSPSNLNYPSLSIHNISGVEVVNRTVTNVGAQKSLYFVTFKSPAGYSMEISPTSLNFRDLGETKSFTITIKKKGGIVEDGHAFGWYAWSDGIHLVRSPIAISSAN